MGGWEPGLHALEKTVKESRPMTDSEATPPTHVSGCSPECVSGCSPECVSGCNPECVSGVTPLDEAIEEVRVGEQPQRVARGCGVDDDTVEVHAQLVSPRQPHELGQSHELIDACRFEGESLA